MWVSNYVYYNSVSFSRYWQKKMFDSYTVYAFTGLYCGTNHLPNPCGLQHACLLSRFSCVQLCNCMDCSPPGSSVHGILQARLLEWVAIFLLQGIFLTPGLNLGLLYYRQILYHWVTGKPLAYNSNGLALLYCTCLLQLYSRIFIPGCKPKEQPCVRHAGPWLNHKMSLKASAQMWSIHHFCVHSLGSYKS